jgi:hypothetical protein
LRGRRRLRRVARLDLHVLWDKRKKRASCSCKSTCSLHCYEVLWVSSWVKDPCSRRQRSCYCSWRRARIGSCSVRNRNSDTSSRSRIDRCSRRRGTSPHRLRPSGK